MGLNRTSHLAFLGRVQDIIAEMFPATITLPDSSTVACATGGISPRTQFEIGGGLTIEADVMFRIDKADLATCPARDSIITYTDPATSTVHRLRVAAAPGRPTESAWSLYCVSAID